MQTRHFHRHLDKTTITFPDARDWQSRFVIVETTINDSVDSERIETASAMAARKHAAMLIAQLLVQGWMERKTTQQLPQSASVEVSKQSLDELATTIAARLSEHPDWNTVWDDLSDYVQHIMIRRRLLGIVQRKHRERLASTGKPARPTAKSVKIVPATKIDDLPKTTGRQIRFDDE